MLSHDAIIEKVREFANAAHGDQKRRYSDDPYIVHPMRVMTTCSAYTREITVLCAAILHDVLEDTPVTRDEILSFLKTIMDEEQAETTTRYVVELTDVFIRQNYPGLNRRARKAREAERMAAVSPEAQTIKYADILDNTDVTRDDPDFARTYLREASELLTKMETGNPELRAKTIARVQSCIQSLARVETR
jgi:guanosine-3',5'-bis(diphosphate) 3'-pyrophosphohydrolase